MTEEKTTIEDLVEDGARVIADEIIRNGFKSIRGVLFGYLSTAHGRGQASQRKMDREAKKK